MSPKRNRKRAELGIIPVKAIAVACRKCHSRKVKCPGGRPCQNCKQINCEADCTYPERDRQIKVSQRYVENIVRENQRLRAGAGMTSQRPDNIHAETAGSDDDSEGRVSRDGPLRNPLFMERPWFQPLKSSRIPILIGEVADAAFATRFRQVIASNAAVPTHIPRLSYPDFNQIEALSKSACPPPNPVQARFLLQTALSFIDGCHHIVRRNVELALLEKYLHAPQSVDLFSESKIFALFALGELHSNRLRDPVSQSPGLQYFSHATKTHVRLLERPSIECIETDLLLCLYSLCINRRHSAYLLASSAVRLGTVMGLHFNLPDDVNIGQASREHMIRVWWTCYVLDQTCAAISGQIFSIPDDEIFVDLPSALTPGSAEEQDFQHTDSIVARVALAKLTRRLIKSLYSRAKHQVTFVQRVQNVLKDLKEWLRMLPDELNFEADHRGSSSPQAKTLQLIFNQCIILTTRPIVLQMLRIYKDQNFTDPGGSVSESVRGLSETCFHCARRSHAIIVEAWIEGSFKTFDPYKTRYLFSSATILAISSVVGGTHSSGDKGDFELATGLLEKLSDFGNFTAIEFYQHIKAMQNDMAATLEVTALPTIGPITTVEPTTLGGPRSDPGNGSLHRVHSQDLQNVVPETIFADPSLEAFMLQHEPSLGQVDTTLEARELDGIYWPDVGIF